MGPVHRPAGRHEPGLGDLRCFLYPPQELLAATKSLPAANAAAETQPASNSQLAEYMDGIAAAPAQQEATALQAAAHDASQPPQIASAPANVAAD